MYMYIKLLTHITSLYIFSSHSNVIGHFHCLHILNIMKNITFNMEMKASLWETDFISSGYISRSGTAGVINGSIFSFWGTSILFPLDSALIYILTKCARVPFLYNQVCKGPFSLQPSVQGSLFSTTLFSDICLSLIFLIKDILAGCLKD